MNVWRDILNCSSIFERTFTSHSGAVDLVWVGCVDSVLIEKNATASSMKPIHISINPTRIMVKTAPISISSPAVLNIPTPDFVARVSSDFLKNMNEMTKNTKRTIKATMTPMITLENFVQNELKSVNCCVHEFDFLCQTQRP